MGSVIKDIISQNRQDLNTDDIIITVHDKDFNIIRFNKAAKKILNLPSTGGTKIKCYKYYHRKNSPHKKCPSYKCLLTREPVVFEIYEPHLNKCMEIRAFPRFDRDNDFIGLIHFATDITDKRVSHKCCM